MIHFLCENCGASFEHPVRRTYQEQVDGIRLPFSEDLCPTCLQPDILEADTCERCGKAKPVEERICKQCLDALTRRFCAFRDTLTYEECDALDSLLEGSSVSDLKGEPMP